jgi:hypothetical protein
MPPADLVRMAITLARRATAGEEDRPPCLPDTSMPSCVTCTAVRGVRAVAAAQGRGGEGRAAILAFVIPLKPLSLTGDLAVPEYS